MGGRPCAPVGDGRHELPSASVPRSSGGGRDQAPASWCILAGALGYFRRPATSRWSGVRTVHRTAGDALGACHPIGLCRVAQEPHGEDASSMTQFWATLIGVLVGGGLALIGQVAIQRRAMETDRVNQWLKFQRDTVMRRTRSTSGYVEVLRRREPQSSGRPTRRAARRDPRRRGSRHGQGLGVQVAAQGHGCSGRGQSVDDGHDRGRR